MKITQKECHIQNNTRYLQRLFCLMRVPLDISDHHLESRKFVYVRFESAGQGIGLSNFGVIICSQSLVIHSQRKNSTKQASVLTLAIAMKFHQVEFLATPSRLNKCDLKMTLRSRKNYVLHSARCKLSCHRQCSVGSMSSCGRCNKNVHFSEILEVLNRGL